MAGVWGRGGGRPSLRGSAHGGAQRALLQPALGQPCCAAASPLPPAGVFSLLRENFSHAPSPDMSPGSLLVLEQLMTAQAQECVFEGLSLQPPAAPHTCLAQLQLAQEAAQVRWGARIPGKRAASCSCSMGSRPGSGVLAGAEGPRGLPKPAVVLGSVGLVRPPGS